MRTPPRLVTEQNEAAPHLSPDSRWVAYTSDESGHRQIYVKQFPSGEGLWTISTNEGNLPRWSPDGDELFYFQGQDLMVVAVKGTDSLDLGRPTRLFTASGFQEGLTVGEGGDSFVLVRPVKSDDTPPVIAIVHNWFSEFRDRQ